MINTGFTQAQTDNLPKIDAFIMTSYFVNNPDFISAEKAKATRLSEKCCVIRISEPVKRIYAKKHNLDLEELMGSGDYKENYRTEMIQWSDEIRSQDPGYFCRSACDSAEKRAIWIVSDIRRKTDIKWFKDTYSNKVKLIRLTAEEPVRIERGWTFVEGIDDVESECGLDDFTEWDLVVSNNNISELKQGIDKIIKLIEK